jgi:hypothetical protein
MDEDHPDILKEGWATPDEYRWICSTSFEDFRDLVGCTVSPT